MIEPITGKHNPKELLYHFTFTTAAGLTYSVTDAVKYYYYISKCKPERFVLWYTDMLFDFHPNVVRVEVIVIDCRAPITKRVIKLIERQDLDGNELGIERGIIARYSFDRDTFFAKEGGKF